VRVRVGARSCVAAGETAAVVLNVARIPFLQSARTVSLFRTAIMSEAIPFGQVMGTCSHPSCIWSGKRVNYAKHKEGCGKGPNIRSGKHEGCTCCNFVPAHPAATEQPHSVLQQTLAALGQQRHVSLHAHMQGEFYRTAMINDRCALPIVCEIMGLTLIRIEFLRSQPYNDGHAQFIQNPNPVEDVHTRRQHCHHNTPSH
jgi:hypothetical protein